MYKAQITLHTCYGDAIIPVEVLDEGSRPGTILVRALDGLEPFTRMSHGGPCQDNTAVVPCTILVNTNNEGDRVNQFPENPRSVEIDTFLESSYEDRTYLE